MARPDMKGNFGGWQAYDATPQELSPHSNTMVVGPASVQVRLKHRPTGTKPLVLCILYLNGIFFSVEVYKHTSVFRLSKMASICHMITSL